MQRRLPVEKIKYRQEYMHQNQKAKSKSKCISILATSGSASEKSQFGLALQSAILYGSPKDFCILFVFFLAPTPNHQPLAGQSIKFFCPIAFCMHRQDSRWSSGLLHPLDTAIHRRKHKYASLSRCRKKTILTSRGARTHTSGQIYIACAGEFGIKEPL